MAPAIRLARDGFVLTRGDTDILDTTIDRFRKDPDAARIFLRPDGTPLQPGDRLVQKKDGCARSSASRSSPDAFYHGEIPKIVEAAAKKRRPDHGGRFRVVPCRTWRRRRTYRGWLSSCRPRRRLGWRDDVRDAEHSKGMTCASLATIRRRRCTT